MIGALLLAGCVSSGALDVGGVGAVGDDTGQTPEDTGQPEEDTGAPRDTGEPADTGEPDPSPPAPRVVAVDAECAGGVLSVRWQLDQAPELAARVSLHTWTGGELLSTTSAQICGTLTTPADCAAWSNGAALVELFTSTGPGDCVKAGPLNLATSCRVEPFAATGCP